MGLVVSVGFRATTLSNDAAYRHSLVSKHLGHTLQTCTFHLEVGDGTTAETEALYLLVQMRVCQFQSNHTSLRSIEANSGDGVSAHHIILSYALNQLRVGVHGIGSGPRVVPFRVLAEFLFKLQVADSIAVGIEIQNAVEAGTFLSHYEIADAEFGLQSTRSADTNHGESAVLGFHGARFEINIGQSVKLRNHYLDVVGTDAVRYAHQLFAFVSACNGAEFAALNGIIDGVEVRGYHVHAARVADKDDVVAQLVRTQMYVESRAIVVDYQL